MGREKKPDFDAEGFIESMRESAVPTYHRAPAKPDGVGKDGVERPSGIRKFGAALSDLEKQLGNLNISDDEKGFIINYAENRFRQVHRQGKQVYVREEYLKIIEQINATLGIKVSYAAYIDNVLAGHFTKYYPLVQSIVDKNPTKL